MQRVRRADMNRVNRGVRQKFAVIAGGALDRQLICKPPRLIRSAGSNTGDFNVTQAAQSFRVHPAHEASSENYSLHFPHDFFLSLKLCERSRNSTALFAKSTTATVPPVLD